MPFSKQTHLPLPPEQSIDTPTFVLVHCAETMQVGAAPDVEPVGHSSGMLGPEHAAAASKGNARNEAEKRMRQSRTANAAPSMRYASPMRLRAAFGMALFAAAVATPSRAAPFLGVGGGDALNLQADQLDIDVSAGDAVLTGNVTLSKGDLRVSCPRIELKFDDSPHVKWARGSGGVSADVRGVHAEAPEVELDLAKQVLDLRGGVRLARGQGWLQADRATINIDTAKVTMSQVKGSVPVPPPK